MDIDEFFNDDMSDMKKVICACGYCQGDIMIRMPHKRTQDCSEDIDKIAEAQIEIDKMFIESQDKLKKLLKEHVKQ